MQEMYTQLSWEDSVSRIPIYTIGYAGRSISQFIELLQKYKIQFLLDVRSRPYSRANSQFSKDALERALSENNVRYVYMGDTLGGRPEASDCYVGDRVDYLKVREMEFYQQGIGRLRTVWEKQIPIVLMCAEIKPEQCHRSKLIGNTLYEQNIAVAHIDEHGNLKAQDEVNQCLSSQQLSLFDDQEPSFAPPKKVNTSRKKYSFPGDATR